MDDGSKSTAPSASNGPASGDGSTARWLDQARDGSQQALGHVFEACRDYLLLVANQEVPNDVRQKVAASDLVQQTLTEACADFEQFNGHSEAELRLWLRRILLNNVADATRGFRNTRKRDVKREVALAGEGSKAGYEHQLVADGASPSGCAIASEEQALLLQALGQLPEHYSEVIRLRNLEYLSFVEIGCRMELSPDSARKLWERAVHQLVSHLRPRDAHP